MNRSTKQFIFPVTFIIVTLMLFSCSTHQKVTHKRNIPLLRPESQHNKSKSVDQRKIIVHNAIASLGVPYTWGGQSPKTGFDCSGLIVYTHQKADIIVPRTAKAQFDSGNFLSKKNLQQADLVFFKNPKETKALHAGIYIGDGVFVHAPGKGRQVTYGYMNNPYFKKHYIGARSYL